MTRGAEQLSYRWERTRRGLGGPSFDEFLRGLPYKIRAKSIPENIPKREREVA